MKDAVQQLFILLASSAEPGEGLRGPTQRCLVFMKVREDGEAALAPELGTAEDDLRGRRGGDEELLRVRVTDLIIVIEGGGRPRVAGDAHAVVLAGGVVHVPAHALDDVVVARRVVEAVEVLQVHWLRQLEQRGVDVVTVSLPRYDEGDGEERLAAHLERRPLGGQRQLLQARDVHVQDPCLLLGIRIHEDEVRGRQVQRPRRLPAAEPVQQPHVLHLWGFEELHDVATKKSYNS